jgi:hypothetical protein
MDTTNNMMAHGQSIILTPGDKITVPRRFERLYLQNLGRNGALIFIVQNDYSTIENTK